MMRRTNQNPFSRNAICSAVRGRRNGTEVGTCGKYRSASSRAARPSRCRRVRTAAGQSVRRTVDGAHGGGADSSGTRAPVAGLASWPRTGPGAGARALTSRDGCDLARGKRGS